MPRRVRIIATGLLLACACRSEQPTTAPDSGGNSGGGWTKSDAPVSGDVPPAVEKLEPVKDAMPLGTKMWRRFGKGEWTANAFFVPDPKTHSVTVILDMQGGGEAVSDAFELVVEPGGLELVEGEPRIDGRVPPGLQRRATWKLSAPQPGIFEIEMTTVKGGEKKGSTTACLRFSDDAIFRCTEAEAKDPATADAGDRATYCCARRKDGAGEGCEPTGNVVDAAAACMKAKKYTLTCDAGVSCTGSTCRCR